MSARVNSCRAISVLMLCVSFGVPALAGNEDLPSVRAGATKSFHQRARVVDVRAPRENPPSVRIANELLREHMEIDPAGVPVVVWEVDDDATAARGGVAAGAGSLEAVLFQESFDSGIGLFGYLVGAETGNFHALGVELSNWDGSGQVTSYDALVLNSPQAQSDATVRLSLWDGDPLGFFDTACAAGGIPVLIPGTETLFSDLPPAGGNNCPPDGAHPESPVDPDPDGIAGAGCIGLYRLNATLPSPVQVDCPRVWMVMELLDGCRLAWRIGDTDNGPSLGFATAHILMYSNDHTEGPTFCCNTGAACVRANSAADCGHADFCTDGIVDALAAGVSDPGGFPPYFVSFTGSIRAEAERVISLVPASADAPPEQNPAANGWQIVGDEIILTGGGRPIWIEGRIGDWDPNQEGILLKAWTVDLDTAGFSSGLGAPLERRVIPCADDGICTTNLGAASTCTQTAQFPGQDVCAYFYVDVNRADFVFSGVPSLVGAVDYGTSLAVGAVCPHDEIVSSGMETYADTFVLWVPPGAEGTYSLTPVPPYATNLLDEFNQFMPLIALRPARVTVQSCAAPVPPQHELPLTPKNRYLSFVPDDAGGDTALRVTFGNLPGAYAAMNGATMWVGPPRRYCHNSGQSVEPAGGCAVAPGLPSRVFYGATLQCAPHYQQWTATCAAGACNGGLREGESCLDNSECPIVLNVFHENIVPAFGASGGGGSGPAIYYVHAIAPECPTTAEGAYSDPLVVQTSLWGDTVGDCSGAECTAPDGVVNVPQDIVAILDRYQNKPKGPAKPRADLIGQTGPTGRPDQLTTIVDVSQALDAFRGLSYPVAPGSAICP